MMHKHGFDVNRTGNDMLDAIRRIRPPFIQSVEHNVDLWREARTVLPDVFLIGRLVVMAPEQDQFMHHPAGTGRAFAERILRLETNNVSVQGRRLFDARESPSTLPPATILVRIRSAPHPPGINAEAPEPHTIPKLLRDFVHDRREHKP